MAQRNNSRRFARSREQPPWDESPSLAVHQNKRYFRFAYQFAIHRANTFGFADFAASLRHLHVEDEGVPGTYWLAPFHALSGHEVSEHAGILSLSHH